MLSVPLFVVLAQSHKPPIYVASVYFTVHKEAFSVPFPSTTYVYTQYTTDKGDFTQVNSL